MNAKEFCKNVIQLLESSSDFAGDYVRFKTQFFKLYQNGRIFSTRFGANFFEETLEHLTNKTFVIASDGKLGEYDVNFNAFLKENF